MKTLRITIPALILATTLTACGGASDPNDENHINGMDRAMAMTLCRKNVEKQLDAPGSAKWQGVTSATIEKDATGEKWGIRTHVDSDNALGASVRTEVVCEVWPENEDTAKVDATLL